MPYEGTQIATYFVKQDVATKYWTLNTEHCTRLAEKTFSDRL